jgi:hypothetical protein
MKKCYIILAFIIAVLLIAMPAMAQTKGAEEVKLKDNGKKPATDESQEELAKAAQNPIANMISIPLQSNFNFNVGPKNQMQYVGNLQPVIPINATENWNVITRTIIPFVSQPELGPNSGDVFGLGDIQFTAFLSPAKPGALIWGVGPIIQMPSGTDQSISQGKWAAGPSAVALTIQGKWLYGGLVNYLSSFDGQHDRGGVSQWLIQPFINYNLPDGWYLTMSPIITANTMAESSQQWTVPVGGGAGKIVKIGKLPWNFQLQAFYNVVHPDAGPEWSIRFQMQLMLPKSLL